MWHDKPTMLLCDIQIGSSSIYKCRGIILGGSHRWLSRLDVLIDLTALSYVELPVGCVHVWFCELLIKLFSLNVLYLGVFFFQFIILKAKLSSKLHLCIGDIWFDVILNLISYWILTKFNFSSLLLELEIILSHWGISLAVTLQLTVSLQLACILQIEDFLGKVVWKYARASHVRVKVFIRQLWLASEFQVSWSIWWFWRHRYFIRVNEARRNILLDVGALIQKCVI